ncbi:hypothetical protein ABIE78_002802 [Sinorhizobium fredii]|uniref:Lipoprotein n=1 Tax=Sinorhizobium fredii (strain USDA 257) TaxID=1185652 RepID=I3X666_SINF2|nr:hypothetical protein [Sinorhizobium fredii]AFL51372.1 hypothetical protein USDA257_c28010 [Sinorhizobium fredii USDA 257]
MRLTRVSAAVLILPALSGCNFFDSELVTACEESLKKRLRSPSRYERIEIVRSEAKMDPQAFAKRVAGRTDIPTSYFKSKMQEYDNGQVSPKVFTVIISYDAPNAYGTPIRSVAHCEYISNYGDDSQASEVTVSIDGQTYMEWLIEGMKAANCVRNWLSVDALLPVIKSQGRSWQLQRA